MTRVVNGHPHLYHHHETAEIFDFPWVYEISVEVVHHRSRTTKGQSFSNIVILDDDVVQAYRLLRLRPLRIARYGYIYPATKMSVVDYDDVQAQVDPSEDYLDHLVGVLFQLSKSHHHHEHSPNPDFRISTPRFTSSFSIASSSPSLLSFLLAYANPYA